MTESETKTGPRAGARPAARTGVRADVIAAAAAVLLFAVAAVIGYLLNDDVRLHQRWPPMHARWGPHLGPGTVPALVVAGLVVAYAPALAARLAWRRLLAAGAAASAAWIFSLALIDGWHRGFASRLMTRNEYLRHVPDVDAVGPFLQTFTDHILINAPDHWNAHVAGHPPGALLTFVGLDRLGLAGGAWASAFVLVCAASIVPAVLITVRALAAEDLARRAAPFLVLLPGAVWLGVSADAYFAAAAAWAVALLALAATGRVRSPGAASLAAGLLCGWLLYLSYGLVLMAPLVLAVLFLARNWRPLPWVLAGVLAVVAAFTLSGFWWFDGYFTLYERYYQGAASDRPYAYYVWANLAVNVLSAGLATVVALRRAAVRLPETVRAARRGGPLGDGRTALVVLVGAAALAAAVADLSGMSKAETERIWLPFVVWLVPATALLPRPSVRWWLLAQAAVALTVNHLWNTHW